MTTSDEKGAGARINRVHRRRGSKLSLSGGDSNLQDGYLEHISYDIEVDIFAPSEHTEKLQYYHNCPEMIVEIQHELLLDSENIFMWTDF